MRTLYAGIDLHSNNSHLAILDQDVRHDLFVRKPRGLHGVFFILFRSRKPPPLGVVRVQWLCQLNIQGS